MNRCSIINLEGDVLLSLLEEDGSLFNPEHVIECFPMHKKLLIKCYQLNPKSFSKMKYCEGLIELVLNGQIPPEVIKIIRSDLFNPFSLQSML